MTHPRSSPCCHLLAVLLLGLTVAACSSTGTSTTETAHPSRSPAPVGRGTPVATEPPTSTAAPAGSADTPATPGPPELPGGGQSIFPQHVVVMYYGTAGSGALGVLGETSPQQAAERLEKAAAPFASAAGRPVLPAFELITSVASSTPGKDGSYSSTLDGAAVQEYIDAARAKKMLVVLDFQPGRATFLEQVKKYEQYLLQPEVGVALDPEWKLGPNQRPLRQIGTSLAAPINDVSAYLSALVQERNLPEKIFLVHQFKAYQLPDRDKIEDRPGLATVLHIDGFGSRAAKFQTYQVLHSSTSQFVNGFKLFYDEDTKLLSPAEALKVQPQPQLFSYQ